MKKIVTLVILISGMTFSHAQTQAEQKTTFPSGETTKNTNITAKVIPSINNTWGYDISVGDKLIIHQLNIPAMPGNEGFKTKKAAQMTADFVIGKMKKGEMPPSVTKEEMKKLKVI